MSTIAGASGAPGRARPLGGQVSTIAGVGPQYPQPDPRGWLVFDYLPDELQRAEDATQFHDATFARSNYAPNRPIFSHKTRRWYFIRPATDAERTLLAHLGHTLPDDLSTWVSWASDTVRCRHWPALESGGTANYV